MTKLPQISYLFTKTLKNDFLAKFLPNFFKWFSKMVLQIFVLGLVLMCIKNEGLAQVRNIVIDVGHGGIDPGNVGKKSKEKDINLQVSKLLGEMLKKNFPKINVHYTRSTDKYVDLHQRSRIAIQKKSDIFISIHCNSMPKENPNRHQVWGTETYLLGMHRSDDNLHIAQQENTPITEQDKVFSLNLKKDKPQNTKQPPKSASEKNTENEENEILTNLHQQTYLENSALLAKKIEESFVKNAKRQSRGVKQAGFAVLREVPNVSVLVEIGFLSNPEEEAFLMEKTGQQLIAKAIFLALKAYIEQKD